MKSDDDPRLNRENITVRKIFVLLGKIFCLKHSLLNKRIKFTTVFPNNYDY